MIKPLELNDLYLLDALIYAVSFNSLSQAATITLEVETPFHGGGINLLPESQPHALVDIVLSGAQTFDVARIPDRHASWAADEKPHDWEIAKWRVTAARFRPHKYVLGVKCWEGQSIRVVFTGVTILTSSHHMAVIHAYA